MCYNRKMENQKQKGEPPVSEYHEKHPKIKQKIEKPEKAFWERIFSQDVLVSLVSLADAAKEGLLALAVQVGLEVFRELLEIELTMKVGEKGKHNPNRQAYRHGYETGEIVLGARKVKVQRPRARTLDGREVELEVYKAFQEEDMLSRAILERMIHGLSCRCYPSGLEDIGSTVEAVGISKSTLSRRFVEMTRKALGELLSRPLNDLDLLVLFIDGVVISDHTVVEALGIDSEGCKHILGLWEGATENATVCKALLEDLVERGLPKDRPMLVVIDGSKALRKAVRDVLGDSVVVQRCRIHKMRNVLDHLPKTHHLWVQQRLRSAWAEEDAEKAMAALKRLADSLEGEYPGAAASIREGLEETLTVTRLGLTGHLKRILSSTNIIESANSVAQGLAKRVKRWRDTGQILRWTAAGLLDAEKRFRRIQGYRQLPLLKAALEREAYHQERKEMVSD